ncbi:MAG: PAC2 family protein [Actinobacteria bacterium]|nr:PAC2 family protein [Actinomycetota bacterium]MSY54334.1 PAC2 family protein [Actinomycetota bacterium]
MEIFQIPALRNPRMVIAFGGWNDAGECATDAITHLMHIWPSSLIAEVDSEDYYDYQVNRPMVSLDETSHRILTWPTTKIFAIPTPHLPFDLVVVEGIEPSMRWKSFSHEIMDLADDLDVALVVTLGGLLADTPHSRPIDISITGANQEISNRLNIELSRYEGPTGIIGVLQSGAMRRGIDAISLWAPVPHYASASPSPKATLALLGALEDSLSITIPSGDLPEEATNWQNSVDELVSEDSEISDYVKQLEASKDETQLPQATGEAIAKEFERYLRRQEEK